MHAVIVNEFGAPFVLTEAEVDEPQPGPGEISIDVKYAGVGFVDTLFRSGAFPVELPFSPGIEVVGRVRQVGANVAGFESGQDVAAMLNDFGSGSKAGGYAEIAVARAFMAVRIDDMVDRATAAGLLINGTAAWIALHKTASLSAGDHVLVLGASGGIGGTACRLAKLAGAKVIGVVGSDAKRDQAPPECARVITAAEFGQLDRITGGHGIDIAFDPVGGELRRQAYDSLAPFGRLVIVGNAAQSDVTVSSDSLWHDTRQICGLSLGSVAHLIPDQVQNALRNIIELLARGKLREPEPAIAKLSEVSEVHRALEDRTAPPKTVLSVL